MLRKRSIPAQRLGERGQDEKPDHRDNRYGDDRFQ